MHGVGEGVVERQPQRAGGAGRGGGGQHAPRAALQAPRLHEQRARVRAARRSLPPAPADDILDTNSPIAISGGLAKLETYDVTQWRNFFVPYKSSISW